MKKTPQTSASFVVCCQTGNQLKFAEMHCKGTEKEDTMGRKGI